jgi:peroxiredoxin
MGKISVGDKAPLFKADSYNFGPIDLEELIGKQKIVLIFSRYFGCPICQVDLKELIDSLSEIEGKGAKVLYITQSSKEKADEFINKYNITFPVIPSPQESKKVFTFYNLYDLGMMSMGAVKSVPGKMKKAKEAGIEHGDYEGWEKQCPGQFVIGEDGNIIQAIRNWLDVESLLEVL